MTGLATTTAYLVTCRALPLGYPVPQCLQFLITFFLFCLPLSCFLLTSSNTVKFLGISYIVQHLFLPSLSLHINIWSLMALLISVNDVSSTIISPMMTSSSIPLINCSVSLLSHLWYSQLAGIVHNLPIH